MLRCQGELLLTCPDGAEYWDQGGEVYRCPKDNVIDCSTGYKIGRWECSREHWDRYSDLYNA